MNTHHASSAPAAPFAQSADRPLTPSRCLFSLFVSAAWMLFAGVNALSCLSHGDARQALINLLMVIAGMPILRAGWKQYRLVKSGVLVYARRDELRLPTAISVIVAGLLTLLVSGVTFVTILFVSSPFMRHDLLTGAAVGIALDGLLWAYVAYCWYRIAQDQQRRKPQEILIEATEGVWPPPIHRP